MAVTTDTFRNEARDGALAATRRFVTFLADIDRIARRSCRTIPTETEQRAVREEFLTRLAPQLEAAERRLHPAALDPLRAEVRTILNPWMLRSGLWTRALLKPHGFAGDFRTMESLYALEGSECLDPTQPAVVNALDGLCRSVPGVQSLWERRRKFAALLESALGRCVCGRSVRVLDVASGGSRHIRDVLEGKPTSPIHIVFVDRDPAALAFIRSWLPDWALADATFVCAPAGRLGRLTALPAGETGFDVVTSSDLFNYLDDAAARLLLAQMASALNPGGTLAISNFSPADSSHVIRGWVSDWHLIYRSSAELGALFPAHLDPVLSSSADGGLLYALATTGGESE